jgi:hypothetical protein
MPFRRRGFRARPTPVPPAPPPAAAAAAADVVFITSADQVTARTRGIAGPTVTARRWRRRPAEAANLASLSECCRGQRPASGKRARSDWERPRAQRCWRAHRAERRRSARRHAEQARRGNNLTKATAITEKGDTVNGVGDTPNRHDMLTGSQLDGTAFTDSADHTCGNWTSGAAGTAQLGHHDRTGGGNTSWNSTHASRGCSQENLVSTGGAGLFYCFAIN